MPVKNAPYMFNHQQGNAVKLLPYPQNSQVLCVVAGKCVTVQSSESVTAERHSNYEAWQAKVALITKDAATK